MKKLLYTASLFCAIVLAAGCSLEDDYESIFDDGNKNAIAPVSIDLYGSNVLTARTVGKLLATYPDKCIYTTDDISGFDTDFYKALLINDKSMITSALEDGKDSYECPDIDFDSYSLVIGTFYYPDTSLYMKDQRIVSRNGKFELYIELKYRSFGAGMPAITTFSLLYPKLPDKPLSKVHYWLNKEDTDD